MSEPCTSMSCGDHFSERLVCDLHETVVDSAELAALRLAMHARDLEAAQAENAALRERAEKAEDTRRGAFGRVVAERDAAQARLARYEAPGPVLLVAEHERHCPMAARGFAANAGMCECSHEERKAAYREQHARCVAVVERVAADLCVTNRDAAVGAKRVLAALTEVAK